MKILITILYLCLSFLNAKDTLYVQQQNVLYVQNLIEIEEKIASNFEKYLLNEFKIPEMSDLKDDGYLGKNFNTTNKFSLEDIDFISNENLKIRYAITKENLPLYINGLYKRDLYRDMTTAYEDSDSSKSYVSFELKSKVAENILDILEGGFTIESECSNSLKETYCVTNLNTIRWYNASSNWIEYNNEKFEGGNVTISTSGLLTSSKLDDLSIGVFVFVNNGDKYLKTFSDVIKVN